AAVELLVVGHELGPVAGEAGQEVLARPRLQVQRIRPDAAGTGLTRRPYDLFELLRCVRDARQDRCDPDRGADPRLDESREHAQPLVGWGGPGLGPPPDLEVEGRDRE